MTNLNESKNSNDSLDVINEISEQVASKIADKMHASEIKKLQEELQETKKEISELKSYKARVSSANGVEVKKTSNFETSLREACKSFDNGTVQVIKMNVNKDDIANEIKAVDTSSFINTYNPAQGGYSIAAPTYAGLVNTNAIVTAPALALCGKVVVGLNDSFYVTYDDSQVNVSSAKEGVEFNASALTNLNQIDIRLNAVSSYKVFSKKMMRINERGEAYFDFLKHNELSLQAAIERKVNNSIMEDLKVENKYTQTFTTATANSLTFDDLFALSSDGLKPIYEASGVLLTNRSTLAYLATLKGTNGQYIWRDIYIPGTAQLAFTLARISSPAGNLNLIGISPKADVNFDAFVGGGTNNGKLIGVYADFSQFMKVAYSPVLQYEERITQDANLSIKQLGLFVKTAYVGFQRFINEAGVAVKIKA